MSIVRPWIRGIIDGISASDLIRSSTISYKNRIAFIILDSTLEITFKNYIVNVKKITSIPKAQWKYRDEIHKILKKHTTFDKSIWEDIEYFYELRTGLYHEDASKTVPDDTIENFQEMVEFIINELFGIDCSKMVAETKNLIRGDSTPSESPVKVPINDIKELINVIVYAVSESTSSNPTEINEVLRRKGYKGTISNSQINRYLNHTFKHLFYYDKYWKLSAEGETRLEEIRKSYLPEITGSS